MPKAIITQNEFGELLNDEDVHPYIKRPVTDGDVRRIEVNKFLDPDVYKVGKVVDRRDDDWHNSDWVVWFDHYENGRSEETRMFNLEIVESPSEVVDKIKEARRMISEDDEIAKLVLEDAIQSI